MAIANALQHEAARATLALSCFNYDAMPSLTSLNLSNAVLLRFCCWYITLRCELDLSPLTWNICLWRDATLHQIWTQLSNPWRSYCDFIVWAYDLEHCFTYCARLWDNFYQVWPSTNYPCLNFGAYDADTLCHAVTLTFDPLTLKAGGSGISTIACLKSVRNLSEIEQSSAELLRILRISVHVISCRDLDLLTLNFYSTFGVMRLNSVQNLSEIE